MFANLFLKIKNSIENKKNFESKCALASRRIRRRVCRAVWVVLVSPRRRRPHRGDKPIFVCVCTRSRVAVCRGTSSDSSVHASVDATRPLFFRSGAFSLAASAFVRSWTHFRNEICEIIAPLPRRGIRGIPRANFHPEFRLPILEGRDQLLMPVFSSAAFCQQLFRDALNLLC